ncbi:MAG: septum formation inhibitor Maf [Candidatus Andersenbacteria bacterium]|nr:septum formation inhibitor Maf [Candidatus Andersenbacteria bacterium]
MKRKIILASGSPQRKKLLETIGLDFEIEKSNYKEDISEKIPAYKLAQKLALGKAQDVAQKHKNAIIIGADSFVVLGKEFLGKPHTPQKAKEILKKISGKKHQLITGIAIIDTKRNKIFTDYEITEVWLKKLNAKEINSYVKTKEPLDKAGGYAIQGIGSILIEKINGNYTNVVGLPINKVYKYLLKLGVNILA